MQTVARVREFNRFYTSFVGALDEGHLESELSLTEVRLLFEIHYRPVPTAADIARELSIDAGYLSRIIRNFTRRRVITRSPSPKDARQSVLSLTTSGRKLFQQLEARTNSTIDQWLAPLSAGEQRALVASMARVRSLLSREALPPSPWLLRTHQAGDMGWVVQSHGELYAREYRWDIRFESLVARIVADFIDNLDERLERCWIAERDGERVGSILCVKHPERAGVAKLRLLLVDPSARGLGIGARLVDECVQFARRAGYHTLTLWTQDNLVAARRIYQGAGFQLVKEEPHHSFGHQLTAQIWEMAL